MKKKKEKSMNKTVSGWLYGWKDIAQYIGCDIKTVQKYVTQYKIPVHRIPEKNKMFAIPAEIDDWGRNVKDSNAKTGFIYFLKAENGFIKIGISGNVEERMNELISNSPVKVELLKTVEGNQKMEKELHEKFKKYRNHGEWFKSSETLMKYIDSL
jgi:hypothetical protein